MPQTRIALAMLLLISALATIACDKKSAERRAAVNEAIQALRKVQGATEVGVTYQQYGQLVIEAKTKVDLATSQLSDIKQDADLKSNLNAAVIAYSLGTQAWSGKIQGRMSDSGSDKVLRQAWSTAKEFTDKAAELAGK
jgi:ABC-type uncharacterized transport system YnjBCD substrate-binding protein